MGSLVSPSPKKIVTLQGETASVKVARLQANYGIILPIDFHIFKMVKATNQIIMSVRCIYINNI